MTSTLHFSLIVPTYNEAATIVTLLDRVEASLKDIPYDVIVVDDRSPDGTAELVQSYAKTHSNIRLVTRTAERGLSSAVLDGIHVSKGKIIGVMDADLSHDERILPALIAAVDEGAELAVGSRRIPNGGADHWPWYRRVLSNIATTLTLLWLGVRLSDPMSGYFTMNRDLYERGKDRFEPKGYKILLEIYCVSHPSNVREIPFIFKDRKQGYSKLTLRVMAQFLNSLIRLRRIRLV